MFDNFNEEFFKNLGIHFYFKFDNLSHSFFSNLLKTPFFSIQFRCFFKKSVEFNSTCYYSHTFESLIYTFNYFFDGKINFGIISPDEWYEKIFTR